MGRVYKTALGRSLRQWGRELSSYLRTPQDIPKQWERLSKAQSRALRENPLFTYPMQNYALGAIAKNFLSSNAVSFLLGQCQKSLEQNERARNSTPVEVRYIGIIMAGNIPAVGFYDLLYTLAYGFNVRVKLSSKDSYLIPTLLELLPEKELSKRVEFIKTSSKDFNIEKFCRVGKDKSLSGLIVSGSDATCRRIVEELTAREDKVQKTESCEELPKTTRSIKTLERADKFSIAVISGKETSEQLRSLAMDMLLYCGMGCRSTRLLFVPQGYNFEELSAQCDSVFKELNINEISSFTNSIAKQRAIATINHKLIRLSGDKGEREVALRRASKAYPNKVSTERVAEGYVLDLGSILLYRQEEPHSPIGSAVLSYYKDERDIEAFCLENAGRIKQKYREQDFGSSQQPSILEEHNELSDFLTSCTDNSLTT